MVYRYLRNLEGVSPPLSLTHLSCQATAKAFTATRESSYFCISHILTRLQSLIECFRFAAMLLLHP